MTLMKYFIFSIALILAGFTPLFAQAPAQPAQTTPAPQEVVVKIQQQAVPAPQTVAQKANEWVEFGKNVGTAMDAGLTSLTDHADKFSKTDAGKFTMAVIAWKVAGKDALELTNRIVHVFFGIPALIAWNCIAIWFFRRIFLPRRVVVASEGNFWNRKKTWKMVNEDDNWSEGKTGGAFATCAVWIIVSLVILFQVIL